MGSGSSVWLKALLVLECVGSGGTCLLCFALSIVVAVASERERR